MTYYLCYFNSLLLLLMMMRSVLLNNNGRVKSFRKRREGEAGNCVASGKEKFSKLFKDNTVVIWAMIMIVLGEARV